MQPNLSSPTRREFVRQTTFTAAGLLGFPAILRSQSPNNLLNVAVIGCGGRGAANLGSIAGENIVALCDVNELSLSGAAKRYPDARQFRDFR